MRHKRRLTALSCLTLAACSSIPRAAVPIPANLTQPCPPLTPLGKGATFGDLTEKAVEFGGMYAECRTRHDALSKLVTQ